MINRKKVIGVGILELPVKTPIEEKDAISNKKREKKYVMMLPISQRHSRVRNLQGMPTLRSKSTKKLDQYLLY